MSIAYLVFKLFQNIVQAKIKQHLTNIWSSIHDKIKYQWGWVEKSVAYKKQVCMINFVTSHNLKIDCEVINSANGDMTLK